jgi:hypothetical protein
MGEIIHFVRPVPVDELPRQRPAKPIADIFFFSLMMAVAWLHIGNAMVNMVRDFYQQEK